MEKERITVFDMIVQVVDGNQLHEDEEIELMKILRRRGEEREEKRMSRCLAGIVEIEMRKKVQEGIIKASTKHRYQPIYRRCFLETEFGNLDAAEITESAVKEFIIEAHESFGLNRNERMCFMGLLQTGLNKMSEDEMLDFVPDKKIYKNYIEIENGKNFILNPYFEEETKCIFDWIKRHPDDIRGLAVGLWFLGEIAPEEIIRLKREDLKDSCGNNTGEATVIKKSDADSYLSLTDMRSKIIHAALDLHPDGGLEYIFMIKKENRWRRLVDNSLSIKLYYICQDIGIKYKAFHKNDVITCGDN